MISIKHPSIATEGIPYLVGVGAGLFISLLFFLPASLVLFPLLCVLVYLYRDPARKIPAAPLGIVNPVDGIVSDLRENTDDPWLNRKAIKITISMQALSVASIRTPIEGKVGNTWYSDGNRQCLAYWIQTDEGDDVVLVVRKRKLRPKCYIQPGERVGQGHRCGFVLFGADVDVYLPLQSRIEVKIGQKICSGEQLIGYLTHQKAPPNLNVEANHYLR